MQEDIERRTVALSVNTAKLTGRVLAKALTSMLREVQTEHQKGQTPQGKQSVKKLMNHGVATNTLPLDGETRLFDQLARKYKVDYAFYKTGPDKHLLFFKSGQADAITACFSEYTKLMMNRRRNKQPSIIQQMKKFADRARSKPHEQERKREAARDER